MAIALLLRILRILINIVSIIAQSIGAYGVLSTMKHSARTKPQRLYLANLCIVEIIYQLFMFVRGALDLIEGDGNVAIEMLEHQYGRLICWTGISSLFYLSTVYIVLDRVAFVYYGLRYDSVWDAKKTIFHLIATWGIGVAISASMVALRLTFGDAFHWILKCFPWVYLTIDMLVMSTSIFSYIFIYSLRKSRRARMTTHGAGIHTPPRRRNALSARASGLVPVCLMISYFLFQMVPNVIYTITLNKDTVKGISSSDLRIFCNILYGFAHLADSVIYIFLLDNVRKFLLGKVVGRFSSILLCDQNHVTPAASAHVVANGLV